MMYDSNMIVSHGEAKVRPKRGSRAFTDSQEWAIYGRVVYGDERSEALAVEFGCTSRTIENVIRRRKKAKDQP